MRNRIADKVASRYAMFDENYIHLDENELSWLKHTLPGNKTLHKKKG
jgi:hypothetical protein